jgi:sRNA-binding carbon storage regulator CsrA
MKSGTMEPKETAVARKRLYKHIPEAKNAHKGEVTFSK